MSTNTALTSEGASWLRSLVCEDNRKKVMYIVYNNNNTSITLDKDTTADSIKELANSTTGYIRTVDNVSVFPRNNNEAVFSTIINTSSVYPQAADTAEFSTESQIVAVAVGYEYGAKDVIVAARPISPVNVVVGLDLSVTFPIVFEV